MFDELEFETDEEIRKAVPEGTVAKVQVRALKDRETGEDLPIDEFKHGESQYGQWMLLPFEVVEGEFAGEWASMMLSIKTSDIKFRNVFATVTGIDVSKGGKVSFDDFKSKLVSGVFEAELGPEVRKGVETGYTRVNRLVERVSDRDVPVSETSTVVEEELDIEDSGEDVPF